MNITEFEQRIIDQKPVESGHYDSEYFTGDWRAEGNNYNLETRRQIEAKNPFLIKDVFQPTKVLDLGCGPGALMHLPDANRFQETMKAFEDEKSRLAYLYEHWEEAVELN